MEKYWRKKVLLMKLEATYGQDSGPLGADAIPAIDVAIRPMEGADVDRGHDTPWLGASGTIPHDLHMVLTCKIELQGSGTEGLAPRFGPALRAMGLAETIVADTSVTYNPISGGFESATIYLEIDGILYAMLGCQGTGDIVVNASGIPQLEATFTGLWAKPTDATAPAPNLTNWPKPLVASAVNTPVFTIGGTSHNMRNFKLMLGNDVQGRFMVGEEKIVIADRSEKIEMQIQATDLATFDPFALARDQSEVALVLTHGTVAGRRATISVPKAQMQRPGAPTEAQGIKEWPLSLVPLPGVGNDQWTLAFT